MLKTSLHYFLLAVSSSLMDHHWLDFIVLIISVNKIEAFRHLEIQLNS